VRLTHWGVAVAVLLNALVTKGGSLTHVSLGWLVMALLLLRLVWGVLGPAEPRRGSRPSRRTLSQPPATSGNSCPGSRDTTRRTIRQGR